MIFEILSITLLLVLLVVAGVGWGLIASGFVTRFRNRWEYGLCRGREARRHRRTGEVQFVIYAKGTKIGSFVYPDDYWVPFNSEWWPDFKTWDEVHK